MKWLARQYNVAFLKFADTVIEKYRDRKPDFVIGGAEDPYLMRWYVIPRNPFFNIYLHLFLRDDDDRALHDHPWFWCSILLRGTYREVSRTGWNLRQVGSVKLSSPWRLHRVVLQKFLPFEWGPGAGKPKLAWTLFITGPKIRNWGFMCPNRGWVPWQEFTDPTDSGKTGKGCEP